MQLVTDEKQQNKNIHFFQTRIFLKKMSQLKAIFNAVVNGALPATTITVVEKVLDNMFTIVKIVGQTVTIKLHDSLGGVVFDLKWNWELVETGEGSFYAAVWEQFPEPARNAISQFVSTHLPNGTFSSFIPSNPIGLSHIVDAAKTNSSAVADFGAKTVSFAGKVFQLDGFLFTILIGLAIKTLFRAFTDKANLSWKKFGQDVATTVASGAAVYGTKFALVAAIAHPPVAVVWVVSAVAGIACAKVVKIFVKGPSSLPKK